jgi:hypothetical protein
MKKLFIATLALCLPMLLSAQGTLTAYYYKYTTSDHKAGTLIVDTNDPVNRMVNYNKTKYKFEGDDTGEYYSSLILKSQVTVKTYEMSPLPVEKIGKRAIFRSTDGYEVSIFKAHANGHRFLTSTDEGYDVAYNAEQTRAHQEFYAISGTLKLFYSDEGSFFQQPLEVEDGCIKLYMHGTDMHYGNDAKRTLRYRPYVVGYLEDEWVAPESYGYNEPAFDFDGDLLTDLQQNLDMPTYLSIAWIEAENALYINGTLYYKQE